MKFTALEGCAALFLVSLVAVGVLCALFSLHIVTSAPAALTCNQVIMYPGNTCPVIDKLGRISSDDYEKKFQNEMVIHAISWIIPLLGALFFGSVGIFGLMKLFFDQS